MLIDSFFHYNNLKRDLARYRRASKKITWKRCIVRQDLKQKSKSSLRTFGGREGGSQGGGDGTYLLREQEIFGQ